VKVKVVIILILLIEAASGVSAERVTFKGTGTTASGDPFILTGKLTKPQGDGPFPALVCLHGCGGISKRDDHWVETLSNWGYVALQVDSFGPRGRSNVCTDIKLIPPEIRAQDAYDAKAFLAGFPFVNKDKIAVMGWSHGGWTTIYTISPKITIENKLDPFRAAIAFYPYCDLPLSKLDAPLLILIGEYDDWTPARMCSQMMAFRKATDKIILKTYPKVYHNFDAEGTDGYVQSARDRHRLLYNSEATADATFRVKEFLGEYLK
jgi:dienelactone hydrolase